MLYGMLPNVPFAGRPKALFASPIGAALNHCAVVLGPSALPIRFGGFVPVSRSAPASLYPTSNGTPLWIVWLALNCHPPRIASITFDMSAPCFLPLPYGSSQTSVRLKILVRFQPCTP